MTDRVVRVVCRISASAGRCGVLPQARISGRADRVLVAVLLMTLGLPVPSPAQVSTSPALSRRPCVGFWLGGNSTFNTERPRRGLDTQLSLDLPIDRTGGLRVAVGRAWANRDDTSDLSVQRLVVYALGERVLRTRAGCTNTVYGGLGAGLYFYDFADGPGRIRRPGYQVVVGGSCVIGRIASSVEMHGRRIKSPGLGPGRDKGVTVIDLLIGVRVRL